MITTVYGAMHSPTLIIGIIAADIAEVGTIFNVFSMTNFNLDFNLTPP